MTDFNEKQIDFLRGNLSRISEKVGCSKYYVYLVLNGRRPARTEKARRIKEIASKVLEILQPID